MCHKKAQKFNSPDCKLAKAVKVNLNRTHGITPTVMLSNTFNWNSPKIKYYADNSQVFRKFSLKYHENKIIIDFFLQGSQNINFE